MQKFNKFSLAVFQKESVPGFPTKKTERQTQTYSDGPQSDVRLPDTRLKSGQGYRTYTVWMISGVALAACSGGGGGGAPAPVATISEHHTPGIEGAQAYYINENGARENIPDAVTDADGNVDIADAVANDFEIYFDLTSATTADGTPAPAVTIRAGDLNLVVETEKGEAKDSDINVLNKEHESFTVANLERLFGEGNIEVISMDQLHEGDDDLQLYAVPTDIL